MAFPLPGLDVPVVDPEAGRMTQAWYNYLQSLNAALVSVTQTGDVDIRNYGAIANDPTKAAVNAAAFAAAWAASAGAYVPAGLTFYVESIVVPTTARRLRLDGNLISAGTYVSDVGIIEVQSNLLGFIVEGIGTITVNSGLHPTNANFRFGSCYSCTVRGLKRIAGGAYNIVLYMTIDMTIDDNHITSYTARSITGVGASYFTTITSNQIEGGTSTSDHAICLFDTYGATLDGNDIGDAQVWPIALQGSCAYFTVVNNRTANSRREAIVVQGSNGIISNNQFTFDNTSIDLGSSFDSMSNTIISNNTWNSPSSPGIFLPINCANNVITDNTFIAPPRRAITGAVNNGSGLIRLTLDTSGLQTGDFPIYVNGVGGVPGANGGTTGWTITVIDATHMDLQGSAFAGLYTSGGFSGDPVWCGVALYSSSGNIISNNTIRNFNASAEHYVAEYDTPSNNKVLNNAGDTPNSYPVKSVSSTLLIDDPVGTVVANLPALARNGSRIYAQDGLVGSNPITGGSTGTWAVRINSVWVASP